MVIGNILSFTTLRLRPIVYIPFIGIVSLFILIENAVLAFWGGVLMNSEDANSFLLTMVVSIILSIVFEGTQRRYYLMRSIYRRQKKS
jgi:hypothetical protein